MSNLHKYKNFVNELYMSTTDIDYAIIEWLEKHEDKYLKLQTFKPEYIDEIVSKIISDYKIPNNQIRYVNRSVKKRLGLDDLRRFETINSDVLPDKYNNLFYTRKDFLKMLDQVLYFYYDEYGIKFLGSGAEGDAFRVKSKDGTKVLKLTKREDEASEITKVRKHSIVGLVDYYDVRKVIDIEDVYIPIYSILMEKLDNLDYLEKSVWSFLRGYFFDVKEFSNKINLIVDGTKIDYNRFIKNNSIERLNDIYEKFKTHRKSGKYGFGIPQVNQIADNIELGLLVKDEAYEKMLEYYKTFCDLVHDAVKYKLKMRDFHTDNAGKDENGNLKFYDVLYNDVRIRDFKLKSIKITL